MCGEIFILKILVAMYSVLMSCASSEAGYGTCLSQSVLQGPSSGDESKYGILEYSWEVTHSQILPKVRGISYCLALLQKCPQWGRNTAAQPGERELQLPASASPAGFCRML